MRWELLPDFQLSIRAATAAGIGVAAAQLLGLPFPIYALISAVVVTDLSASETRKLAPARLAATILGAAFGASVIMVLPHTVWTTTFGIFAAMLLSRLFRLRDAKLAGYVSGIVLLDHGDHPWSYALLRVIETGLGIAAAILISFVPKFFRADPPDQPNE